MSAKTIILVFLVVIMAVPVVHAEDSLDWYTRGQSAITAGNYADAITYFNNALSLEKNYGAALSGKAVASNGLGRYGDAINLSEQALAIRPSDQDALNARALALFRLGRYEESVTAYDKLFKVQTNRVDAFCNQGYAYLQLEKYEAAVVSYDRCTAIDPSSFMSWNNKGQAYLGTGQYDRALGSLDRATSITVTNATAWNNKGIAYTRLGKPQDALDCFKKALGIDPNFVDAKMNRDNVTGKLQVVNITGTVTPVPTISRIGTFYTTATPAQQLTGVTTSAPEVTPEVTVIVAPVGTTSVQKKTTYSPIAPVTVLGALLMVSGIVFAIKSRQKK